MAFFTKSTLWGKVEKKKLFVLLLLFGKQKELEKNYEALVFFPSGNNPSVGNTNKAIFKSHHMT